MTDLLRNMGMGVAGYLASAFGWIYVLYGYVPPFSNFGSLFGLVYPVNPLICLPLIPLGLALATVSAVLDADRRAPWPIHRLDYFFALVGAGVVGILAAGVLEWGRHLAIGHALSWSMAIALAGYCWETTVVRLRARTLSDTICWRRVFATLPVRQFSGAFILIVVVVGAGLLLGGFRSALSIAMDRTDYNPMRFSAWLASGWLPFVVGPALLLAVVAILGLNIVTVTTGQQRAIEAQLREERFRAELITNVTHDLRTPLTSIISYADLIDRYPTTDPTLSEYAAVLGRKAERLRVLIGDVLDASRVSAGTVEVNPGAIELNEILGQVAGDLEPAFAGRDLTWVSAPSAPCVVSADGALLWRILENLVGNVAKHARPSSEVHAEVLALPQGGAIRLRNQLDAPLTVAPETLTGQFVRGDQARHGEGGGLGLFIADRLATTMGATLRIETEGTEFLATVTLPYATQPGLPRSVDMRSFDVGPHMLPGREYEPTGAPDNRAGSPA